MQRFASPPRFPHPHPFSILGRIERDATRWTREASGGSILLSVSSVGSSGMQQLGDAYIHRAIWAFSILGRIERDATMRVLAAMILDQSLSVSSVGSSGMQRVELCPARRSTHPFQYPRSDRAGCNSPLFSCSLPRQGSFQYPRSDRAGCNPRRQGPCWYSPSSFSILGRIERDATAYSMWACICAGAFQYPRSDRAGCNRAGCWQLPATSPGFQYPRSDRAGCNPPRQHHAGPG